MTVKRNDDLLSAMAAKGSWNKYIYLYLFIYTVGRAI